MPWTGSVFLAWFEGFVGSPEARRLVRSVAARHDVSALADDLLQNWYFSIWGTVDRMTTSGASLPSWLDNDDAAIRYAARALHNDAVDLVRVQRREAGRAVGLDEPREVPFELVDPAPLPEDATAAAMSFDDVRRELVARYQRRELGCAQCRNDLVLPIALAVVEQLSGGASVGIERMAGGTDELDEVIYLALGEIDPERFAPVNGRMPARTRQMKSRCKARTVDVLRELLAQHHPTLTAGREPEVFG